MDTDDYTSPIPEDAIARAAALTAELTLERPNMSTRCLAAKAVRLFFCPCVSCDGTCGCTGEGAIQEAVVAEVVERAEALQAKRKEGKG